MQILFFFLVCIYVSQCKIAIKDAGVATLTRGDVGMIFYVTLTNCGACKYHINVRMLKCCESFEVGDMDCSLMNLMGGDMGWLHPNVTKNISLLYPNMFLHNRKGQCLIAVAYSTAKNATYEIRKGISFDTFITDDQPTAVLRGYYNKREFSKCDTIDLDPIDNCEPINCQMKYLGCRNYFNYKWNRCQKVPVCIADPEKELPDVSYLPISNMCRDLENLMSVEDLKHLEKGIIEGCWENQVTPELSANLRCHHGKLSNETGFCVCHDGWMSAPLDKDQYEPSLSIYHMCNIEIGTWNGINSSKVKMTALIIAMLGILLATCTIMLSFICHLLYQCIEARRTHYRCPSQIETICVDKESASGSKRSTRTAYTTDEDGNQRVRRGALKVASARPSEHIHNRSDTLRSSGVSEPSLGIVATVHKRKSNYTEENETGSDDTGDTYSDMEVTESFHPEHRSRTH